MNALLRLTSIATLSLVLVACQAEKKPEHKGTVAGEILPGSASDAMLPYDTVRSQPPLAPQTEASTDTHGPRAERSGAATRDEEAEPAADGAPDPAPTPTIAVEPVE
jgi:hypothetical protein